MLSSVGEPEFARRREGPGGLRNEDLVRLCGGHDASGLMHSDAADVATRRLNLSDMDPSTDVKTMVLGSGSQGVRAADGSRGTVEDHEHAVAGRLHLTTVGAVQLGSHDLLIA